MDNNVVNWPASVISGLRSLIMQIKPNEKGGIPESFTRAVEDARTITSDLTAELYRFAGVEFVPTCPGVMLTPPDDVEDDGDLLFHIAHRIEGRWQLLILAMPASEAEAHPLLRERLLLVETPAELARVLRTVPVPYYLLESVPGLAA